MRLRDWKWMLVVAVVVVVGLVTRFTTTPPPTATPSGVQEECQEVSAAAYMAESSLFGHPSFYQKTGLSTSFISRCWTVDVKDGFVLIIGGSYVDGRIGGILKAVAGPAVVTTRVTDGFIAVVPQEEAENKFCSFLWRWARYGWAPRNVYPLEGWTCPIPRHYWEK